MPCIICNAETKNTTTAHKKPAIVCSKRCLVKAYFKDLIPTIPKYIRKVVRECNPKSYKALNTTDKNISKLKGISRSWLSGNNDSPFLHLVGATREELSLYVCECGEVVNSVSFPNEIQRFCSSKCRANSTKQKQMRVETVMKKYGVTNVSQSNVIKQRKIDTCKKNHGVDHPQQSDKVRRLTEQNNIDKFGVCNPIMSKAVSDKRDQTMLDKYGAVNIRNTKHFQEKRKDTCMEKYGTAHHMQVESIKEKVFASTPRRNGFTGTLSKEVTVQDKTFRLRGFEDKGLQYLIDELGYKAKDISNSNINMPRFMYKQDDKSHRYFPDFFVEKEDGTLLVVEIKSLFTAGINVECSRFKNLVLKARSVNKMGYEFLVIIYPKRGNPKPFTSRSVHKAKPKHLKLLRSMML